MYFHKIPLKSLNQFLDTGKLPFWSACARKGLGSFIHLFWALFLQVSWRKYGLGIASFRHYFAAGKNKELLINIVDVCSKWSNKE